MTNASQDTRAEESDGDGAVTVSVVSHGHADLVGPLLEDLSRFPEVRRVILTVNVTDAQSPRPPALASRLVEVHNLHPRGFAANHNSAFALCETRYFCVLNPDIRIAENPFPVLLRNIVAPGTAFVAPLIKNPAGGVEDSARIYPTPLNLLLRVTGVNDGRYAFNLADDCVRPDWIAGMFMLFDAGVYASLRGFDEAYFLYCEDIDLCRRARDAGYDFVLCPAVSIVHNARRTSRRSVRYALWHTRSMARFLRKHATTWSRRATPHR